jgi:hypothetical protein
MPDDVTPNVSPDGKSPAISQEPAPGNVPSEHMPSGKQLENTPKDIAPNHELLATMALQSTGNQTGDRVPKLPETGRDNAHAISLQLKDKLTAKEVSYLVNNLEAYAEEGQLNLVAQLYSENKGIASRNEEILLKFVKALKIALGACAKHGWLESIASFKGSMAMEMPQEIRRRIPAAAFHAMRVCIRRKDFGSILSFLQKDGMPKKACLIGVKSLVRMRMFAQIGELLRINVLSGDALAKAQKAYSAYVQGRGNEHMQSIAVFRKKRKALPAGPVGSAVPSNPPGLSSFMPTVPRNRPASPRFVAGTPRNRK